jgi:uncharacterized membrane protein
MNIPPLPPDGRMTPRKIAAIFLTGLIAVLPILVTLALVMWLIRSAESVLGGMLGFLLPSSLYLPGMGLVLAVGLIFVVGLALQGVMFRSVLLWIEEAMNRIPLVKTVYGAVRDLTGLMENGGERKPRQVVLVAIPNVPIRLVGFVTVESLADAHLPAGPDEVAVYLPMSYQIGGYTLLLPRSYLTPVTMSFEEAMRFVITAGVSRHAEQGAKP